MKLLYLASSEHPFLLPHKNSAGGIGTLEPILLDWLLEKYKVDILCPSDSHGYPPYKDIVIKGDFKSKELAGRCDMVGRTKSLLNIADRYDYVFCNDNRFNASLLLDAEPRILQKFRMINHASKQDYFQAFAISQYQMQWVMTQRGSKVAHVQPDMDQEILKNISSIRKNPYRLKGEDLGVFGEKFHHIDLLVTNKEASGGSLSCEDIWVAVGRAVSDKRLPFAYKAWKESGVQGEFHIFAQDPRTKKSDLDELISIAKEDPSVNLVINAPQSQVFQSLKKAKGLLFPSQRESMGLVGFEANCCGAPVIYSNPVSERFLKVSKENIRVTGGFKNWSKAIQSSNVDVDTKKLIRDRTLSTWSREMCKQKLIDFIEN